MATPLYGILYGEEPINNLMTMDEDKITIEDGERSFGETFASILDDLSSGVNGLLATKCIRIMASFQAGCGHRPDLSLATWTC